MPRARAVRCSRCTSRGSGVRQGTQQPDPGVDHERGGREPGQQRDLRVPLLDGEQRPELEVPPVTVDLDLLLRQRERDPATGGLAGQAQLAHLLEEHQRLVGAPLVDRLLGTGVVEPGGGANACPLHLDLRAFAGLVDLDRPEQCGTDLVGQQRAGVLGDRLRVQRHLGVCAVQRFATQMGLEVDGVARRDERRDVGDGVVDDVARRRRARCAAPGRGPSPPEDRW